MVFASIPSRNYNISHKFIPHTYDFILWCDTDWFKKLFVCIVYALKVQVSNPFRAHIIYVRLPFEESLILLMLSTIVAIISAPVSFHSYDIHRIHLFQVMWTANALCMQIDIITSGYFPSNLITIQLFPVLLIKQNAFLLDFRRFFLQRLFFSHL